ncbi:protein kinase [Nostocales cyanobacterium LEGE 11386]|nr:protein kinase [Nostocales cyanobacterium LEGE 11386]
MSLCINPVCPQPYHPNEQDRFCKSCGSQLELLGRYRVISLLSDKNGFSKVYEAYAQDTPKILKVLNEEISHDAQAVELFCQEASLLEHLNHPHIPIFEGYFQYQTRNNLVLHCIVMEKSDQPNLEEWLKQHDSLMSQAQVVDWLKKLVKQQTGTATANVVNSSQTHVNLPKPAKQSETVPLPALFAALLVSLGLLSLTALATRSPQFAFLAASTQSPQRKGTIDYFPYEAGQDSQGRIAQFNIAVLSIDYKWLVGSNFQIKYHDKVISLDVLKLKLEQESIQTIMEDPSEIISVGMATCEGNKASAERIALERSQQIQRLAKRLFSNTPSVQGYRLLNLGQFQRNNCLANQDLTAYQNSVIIIGVKKQSDNVILDEALRDRLKNKPFADFKLKDYSLGSADSFATIFSN